VEFVAAQMSEKLSNFVVRERVMMQTRQLAFERILQKNCPWFNEEVLALEVAAVEDDAQGLVSVEDEVKEGDKVRLDFQMKSSDATEWTPVSKLAVVQVNVKGPNGAFQTHEVLEKSLLGLKIAEEKELLIPEAAEENKEPENTRVKVVVRKICRKPLTEDKAS
jgi:hypothetical protein